MLLRPFILFASLIASSITYAFSVTPMLTEIDLAKSQSANLKVNNDSDTPIRVEISVFEKVQLENGEYDSPPTKAIIVFPPLLEVPANATRTIRLVLVPEKQQEAIKSYYKVVVHQMPTGQSTAAPQDQQGIQVKVELTTAFHIPIYVYPKKPAFAIALKDAKIENGKVITWIQNTGNTIARLVNQNAFIQVNGKWISAMPKSALPNRVNALVFGKTIRQEWDCLECKNKTITGIKIEGESNRFGKFEIIKMLPVKAASLTTQEMQ